MSAGTSDGRVDAALGAVPSFSLWGWRDSTTSAPSFASTATTDQSGYSPSRTDSAAVGIPLSSGTIAEAAVTMASVST